MTNIEPLKEGTTTTKGAYRKLYLKNLLERKEDWQNSDYIGVHNEPKLMGPIAPKGTAEPYS